MAAGLGGRGGLREGLLLGFLLSLVFVGAGAEPAAAVEVQTHVFDPVLSLTGNCQISEADPVEDPWCPGPPAPSGRFNVPRSETIDEFGDIYVASTPPNRVGGVIDIFSPAGEFLTEIADNHAPLSVAVDSEGHLYVFRSESGGEIEVVRYDPEVYEPEAGKVVYEEPPTVVTETGWAYAGVAVDPGSDHLYIDRGTYIEERSSAAEGNLLVTSSIGSSALQFSADVAIDPVTHNIYASDVSTSNPTSPSVVKVFEASPPFALIRTIDGSACLPEPGHFHSDQGYLSIAVDGSNGHLFVYDGEFSPKTVYEFDNSGSECISKIERNFSYTLNQQIAIDNGAKSPNGGEDPDGRYLFVPSGLTAGESHLWAFEPRSIVEPPEVESVSFGEVSTTDATLEAAINPKGGDTRWTLEYTSEEAFEAGEWEGAILAGEGEIPAGKIGVDVSAVAEGLSPGTTYRFRATAENDCETVLDPETECYDEEAGRFTTFATPEPLPPCENDPLRLELGLSALLPDCRAYELVSPPSTGGRALFDPQFGASGGDRFGSNTASPEGDAAAFATVTGSLPGTGAGGLQGTA